MTMLWSCWPLSSRVKWFKRSWICWLRAGEKCRKWTRVKNIEGDKGAIIHHLKMVIAFCLEPIAWSLMISAKIPFSIHPEEAIFPLRWLCQLPLCGLAIEERLQAIIPRQQVNIPTTVLKSIGFFCTIKRRFNRRCQYHIWKSASSNGARAALPLPELLIKPEKNCSPSMTRNPKYSLLLISSYGVDYYEIWI